MKPKTAYFMGIVDAKLSGLLTDLKMAQFYSPRNPELRGMMDKVSEIQHLMDRIWSIENSGMYQMDMGEIIDDGEDRTV